MPLIGNELRNLSSVIKEDHLDKGHSAGQIDAETFSVEDVADYFTATTIEGVLAEIYADLNTIGVWDLTSAEVSQLKNIDTTTISTTQWGYIGEQDQSTKIGTAPTFTANNFSDGGSNAIITTTQETNFETAYTHSQVVTGNPHDLDSNDIEADQLGTPTYTTLQDFFNTNISAGRISGGVISDGGSGTVNVTAGTGVIKSTDNEMGDTMFFDWGAKNNLVLTDLATNYIYVGYNGGNPQVYATTDRDSIEFNRQFPLGISYRNGNYTWNFNDGVNLPNYLRKNYERLISRSRFERTSGGEISEYGTRNIESTDGVFYRGHDKIVTTAKTSTVDYFTYVYYNGTSWVWVNDVTQIDNTQYNNIASGLATLSNNKYGIHWVCIDFNGGLYVVYGQGDYTLTDAQNAPIPSLMPVIAGDFGIIAAKIIIEKSAAAFTSVDSAYVKDIPSGSPSVHNDLSGLHGDYPYYHLNLTDYNNLTDVNAQLDALHTDGSPTFNLLTLSTPLANASVANDITLTNLTQITTKSHTVLSDIGSNAHSVIDTHLASTSNPHTVTRAQLNIDTTDTVTFAKVITTGDIEIGGDLTVSGTTTTIDTVTLEVEDNIILVNSNMTGTPPTTLKGGLEIERGTSTNYQLIFDEFDDTFKVGEIGNLVKVAAREDAPNDNGLGFWNNTSYIFETDTGITFDGSNLILTSKGFKFGTGATVTVINTTFVDNDTSLMTSQAIKEKIENYGYSTTVGTVTNVTGTAPVVSSGGATPAISMLSADATRNGYMTLAYASKLDGIASGATVYTDTDTENVITAELVNGQSIDNAIDSLISTHASDDNAHHNPVTIGTGNGLSLSTQVISLVLSSTSTTGALSNTNWNTFNGKQDALGFTAVPNTRTVNGHALSSNVTVTKGDVGLGNVENTALSTWVGTANITTLGTIGTGVWNAGNITITGAGAFTSGTGAIALNGDISVAANKDLNFALGTGGIALGGIFGVAGAQLYATYESFATDLHIDLWDDNNHGGFYVRSTTDNGSNWVDLFSINRDLGGITLGLNTTIISGKTLTSTSENISHNLGRQQLGHASSGSALFGYRGFGTGNYALGQDSGYNTQICATTSIQMRPAATLVGTWTSTALTLAADKKIDAPYSATAYLGHNIAGIRIGQVYSSVGYYGLKVNSLSNATTNYWMMTNGTHSYINTVAGTHNFRVSNIPICTIDTGGLDMAANKDLTLSSTSELNISAGSKVKGHLHSVIHVIDYPDYDIGNYSTNYWDDVHCDIVIEHGPKYIKESEELVYDDISKIEFNTAPEGRNQRKSDGTLEMDMSTLPFYMTEKLRAKRQYRRKAIKPIREKLIECGFNPKSYAEVKKFVQQFEKKEDLPTELQELWRENPYRFEDQQFGANALTWTTVLLKGFKHAQLKIKTLEDKIKKIEESIFYNVS